MIPALFFTSATLEASRARPRVVAASENVRLAMPHSLSETSEKGRVGLDFDEPRFRQQALQIGARYLQIRRQPRLRNSFEKECAKTAGRETPSDLLRAVYCQAEADRLRKTEPPSDSSADPRRNSALRRDLAEQLRAHNWSAVSDVSYPSVVNVITLFKDKSELLQMGRALSKKSACVGSKVATALAYKLEESFPEPEPVEMARALYDYASGCGSDFASAKASYRLALLEVWQNRCDRVPRLMSKVEQTAEASQFNSRAKYWRAYCSEVLGEKEASREARESLLAEHAMSFHNLAANGQQGQAVDWITRETDVPLAFRSLVRPENNSLLLAIEVLIKLKAIDLAAELTERNISIIQQFEPEVRLYVAALMHKHSQALPKFRILSSLFSDSPRLVSKSTMKLYYPLRFFDITGPVSGSTLDPLLVTALIRQESAFNTRARSRVGARGLMQLMPATAKMMSRIRTGKLYEPQTNIALGTQYLRKRLAQYDGDVELTLAAYNAGFSRVDEWKRRYPTDNRILFLDLIPFKETREYVSSILRNYYWYTKLYGKDPMVALQRSASHSSVAAARDVASDNFDLSPTYQAITRAQSGLVTALHKAGSAIASPATEADDATVSDIVRPEPDPSAN